jgi:hypothetical protein
MLNIQSFNYKNYVMYGWFIESNNLRYKSDLEIGIGVVTKNNIFKYLKYYGYSRYCDTGDIEDIYHQMIEHITNNYVLESLKSDVINIDNCAYDEYIFNPERYVDKEGNVSYKRKD